MCYESNKAFINLTSILLIAKINYLSAPICNLILQMRSKRKRYITEVVVSELVMLGKKEAA
jgi:hypothetical protein